MFRYGLRWLATAFTGGSLLPPLSRDRKGAVLRPARPPKQASASESGSKLPHSIPDLWLNRTYRFSRSFPLPKVGFVSLGCPKNLVDSEVMMGLLTQGGFELTPRAED